MDILIDEQQITNHPNGAADDRLGTMSDWLDWGYEAPLSVAQRLALLTYAVKDTQLPEAWAIILAGEVDVSASDMIDLFGVYANAGMELDRDVALRLTNGTLYMYHIMDILRAFRRGGKAYYEF